MPRGRKSASYLQTPVQPSQPSVTQQTEDDAFSGLYIFGQVTDRTRRNINTRNGSSAEIVTYTVQDKNDRRYFVDEYTPVEYYELGEVVEVPCTSRPSKRTVAISAIPSASNNNSAQAAENISETRSSAL